MSRRFAVPSKHPTSTKRPSVVDGAYEAHETGAAILIEIRLSPAEYISKVGRIIDRNRTYQHEVRSTLEQDPEISAWQSTG